MQRRWSGTRAQLFWMMTLALALGLITALPASAQTPVEGGTGAVSGPEALTMSGNQGTGFPLCLEVTGTTYDLTTVGDETSTYSGLPSALYQGPVTIEISSDATYYIGPQGIHYGSSMSGDDCALDNLGAPVPATITITDSGGTAFSCEDMSGSFRRISSAFAAGWDTNCDVSGNVPPLNGTATTSSSHTFVGELTPCGPVPCPSRTPSHQLKGVYEQHPQ